MEFNLLDEPWIRVMDQNCREKTVSLKQVFAHAEDYVGLAGELPTQDIAILRLLLAILHTVFYRVDEAGQPAPIEEDEDAYQRWQALWEMGHFPQRPIEDYLERWRDRFWLFHPERPFYQVPEAKIGTEYTAAKLNGEISESGNKTRLFSVRTSATKDVLSYAEAARWLLYLNSFDDTSAKPKGKNLPSVGAGWLGKLGLIAAKGKNLYETLLLNLVLLDEESEPWGEPRPVWELENPRCEERVQLPKPPDNQAELLTLQSRRLYLVQDSGIVTGYYLLGGDFFNKQNAFVEQMTLWKPIFTKREITGYQPARHNASRKMWQDFASLAAVSDLPKPAGGTRQPGVVRWAKQLSENECLDAKRELVYQIVSVQYGDKDFFVENVFEDSLAFHLNLLTEFGHTWVRRVTGEVALCDDIAKCLGKFAADLVEAASGKEDQKGGSKKDVAADLAKAQFFFRVDLPFRQWLRSLDASQSDTVWNERRQAWRDQALSIARQLGRELVDQAGPAAYRGHLIKKNDKDPGNYLAAPLAYKWFQNKLYEIVK